MEEIPGQAGQNPILTSAAIVKARSRFSICLFCSCVSSAAALWKQVVGYGLLLTLCAISPAGYAWLLSRAGRIYESSDAVLMRVKKPIDSRPFGNRCIRSPPVDVPIGTSNTFRSLLFAFCSSTINKAIEYIILFCQFSEVNCQTGLCRQGSSEFKFFGWKIALLGKPEMQYTIEFATRDQRNGQ